MDKVQLIIKVLRELSGTNKFIIKGDNIIWRSDRPQPTEKQIQAKIKELEEQEKIDNAYTNLQNLCDTKSKEAKNYIVGHPVTEEQLARYEEKYQIAKEYLSSGKYKERLSLEAKLQGLKVDELANLIVKKGDEYKEALITFNARIEAFRVKVADLIENGKIDKANEIIKKAQNWGADTTNEVIAKLFES